MRDVQVESVAISSFRACGGSLELRVPGNAVVCGPNDSGKTTVLSALGHIRRLLAEGAREWKSVLDGRKIHVRQVPVSRFFPVTSVHRGQETSRLGGTLSVSKAFAERYLTPQQLERLAGLAERYTVAVSLAVLAIGDESLVQLEEVRLQNRVLFRRHQAGVVLVSDQNAGSDYYVLAQGWTPQDAMGMFSLVCDGYARILYQPAKRVITNAVGAGAQLDDISRLADGSGVAAWIQDATQPSGAAARSRARQLHQACQDVAKFLGVPSVSITTDRTASEVLLTINDAQVPLDHMGAGVAECVLILLVTRIGAAEVDVLVLEEPELHLHPRLQRRLVDVLLSTDMQLVCSTHSPTILASLARAGATVLFTEFSVSGTSASTVTVESIAPSSSYAKVLESLGAAAADLMQCDAILWAEGVTDAACLRAWLSDDPRLGVELAVIHLAGDNASSDEFGSGSHPERKRMPTLES